MCYTRAKEAFWFRREAVIIANGEKKYTTLKDVAELANVSIASVSTVLSGSDKRYVSGETREKVLEAARKLNYVKSSVATGLRGGSQKVVALLVPQFENPFFTRLAVSVEAVVGQKGYTLFVCDTKDDPLRERQIVENVIGHRVDGIILSPTVEGAQTTELIRKFGIPYVVADRPLEGVSGYDLVTHDNHQVGYMCGQEFLRHGHSRFGYVGWKTGVTSISQRQQGFEEAIRGKAEYYSSVLQPEYGFEQGYGSTRKLLETGQRVTALLFGHHSLARGGVSYFNDAGIEVPRDLSVIVIGSPEWTKVLTPRYTCIYQPVEEMGALAARMLFEKLEGTRTINETRILQSVLEKGGTVSAPPSAGIEMNEEVETI